MGIADERTDGLLKIFEGLKFGKDAEAGVEPLTTGEAALPTSISYRCID
jgi:hypothetical protein